jgi:hypothetical protein
MFIHASRPSSVLPATMLFVLAVAGNLVGQETELGFAKQIRAIFEAKCFKCHSADKRKAGLAVTSVASLVKGGESGAVVVSGKPDESLLFELIRDGEMPPEDEGELSAGEIETIRRWIADGAEIRTAVQETQITQHQIVPLMLLRCTACHGGRRREADLDLRTKAAMLKGGKSGPAVVAGKPEESLIVKRIHAEEMPPRRKLVQVSVKPMEASELAMLESWISAGMPQSDLAPDVATSEPDPLVSDEDRQFWSFQPPQAAIPPTEKLDDADRLRAANPIDVFITAKLRERNLSPAEDADRVTLIRRLYIDLLGLLPSPDEVAAFVSDTHPLAYENLVDRLLASPRYGERWGRHWLDVAGYADSEGSQNEDRVRPHLWRYRDYVVRAFNADKPYDRFLQEQIAGDELADYENAEVITDEIYDNLVATGFLRTAPDRTFAGITNFVPDRLELIADEIQILGSAVLGLTLHCCRCHTHKFDPLPQRDYYRLAAALKDAYDEHDWLKPEERRLTFVTTAERQAWEQHEKSITDQVAALREKSKAEKDDAPKKELEEQFKQLEAGRKPEPKMRVLWARGQPSPTYVLKRGNYLTPGHEVGPGVPSMLTDGKTPFEVKPPWPSAKTTGRRLALARWITGREHPLTSRVMVNRIWEHHFGRGIVVTPGNFGTAGAMPTHPELLDWLAVEFVRQGWSTKALNRLIVTSKTYQQSSQVTSELLAADPENELLSRMPLRRMEAEAVRDSLLLVAGQLDETPFGAPDDVEVRGDGLVTSKRGKRGWRRSVYVLHRRTKMPTILENFDSPQMGPNCIQRDESIVAPQALHLLNNAMIHELAGSFAERIEREAGDNSLDQIVHIHKIAFGHEPTDDARDVATSMLRKLTELWTEKIGSGSTAPHEAARRALANYCHAVMNSAAFVYVD